VTHRWVSGGVDCGRKRRNVYDKKPQRYSKDNRTAHLTARSDKSVAYVTNNKRLRFVLLELTTDRHKASRGLSVTAELLVSIALSCTIVELFDIEQYCELEVLVRGHRRLRSL